MNARESFQIIKTMTYIFDESQHRIAFDSVVSVKPEIKGVI